MRNGSVQNKNDSASRKSIANLNIGYHLSLEKRMMIHDSCITKKEEWYDSQELLRQIIIAVVWMLTSPIMIGYLTIFANYNFEFKSSATAMIIEKECLVSTPEWLSAKILTKPPFDCHQICQNLTSIPVHENISPDLFTEKYAYTGLPVLIRGAVNDWQAWNSFNFSFLNATFQSHAQRMEELYQNKEVGTLTPLDARVLSTFQFIPYRSDFKNLVDFFNKISKAQLKLEPSEKSYYVGWSNCFPKAINELQDHYKKPKFLPHDSESSYQDWIFIGGITAHPVKGRPAHVDQVDHLSGYRVYRPSWYAVVSGSKTWTLYPPPECECICKNELEVTVKKGDLLIIDTTEWLTRTKTEQGVLTITIESDYD